MTLTVMFNAPWNWLPFLNICWDETKCLAMGWGPLQIYLTNYSPIAVNNTWYQVIYCLLDKDEEKAIRLINTVNNNYDSANLDNLIDEIKK